MPKNKAKRWRPEPEPGDPRMLPDEPTPEPPEQDQVLNEEELPGDYAGDRKGARADGAHPYLAGQPERL